MSTSTDLRFRCRARRANSAGSSCFEIEADDGRIPDAKTRVPSTRKCRKHHHENLLIFVDRERTQSLWYWVKRQDGKLYPRDHLYLKGQPGDLFLSKLGQMVFDLSRVRRRGQRQHRRGRRRVRTALDVERVTKKFFREFQEQHVAFLELIDGHCGRAPAALVRLGPAQPADVYLLPAKEGVPRRRQSGLPAATSSTRVQEAARTAISREFPQARSSSRASPSRRRSGRPGRRRSSAQDPYLNGGLFLPHRVEQDNPSLDVPDRAFENLFDLFDRYSWNLDDTPGGQDNEINPDVLGYIFEKYINQKAFGAYYTRTEITEYLCERTIHQLILDAVNTPECCWPHRRPG